ncbi:hypothetical protein ACS0TY_006545 [Phlomoides rotata]
MLTSTIGDYFHDEQWHFDYAFFMKHTDILKDIVKIHVSRDTDDRVWGSSVSGHLTSRMAYDMLRSSFLRVGWSSYILGSFIPPCRSTLIWRAIWGKLPTANWLRYFGVHGPTATNHHFGRQISCLWRIAFITTCWSVWYAHNRATFDDVSPSVHRSLAFILASIKEAAPFSRGHMVGSVRELLILDRLGVSGRSAPARTTTIIRWRLPQVGWFKVNVDGSAPSSPGPLYAGAIFRNSRGFFVAAFAKSVGVGISFGS